jgi:hypothetical protein
MDIKQTGYVMLVGDPGVGKTAVTRALDVVSRGETPNSDLLAMVRRTNTLEYEYLTTSQKLGGADYAVTIQFLVPPGRREGIPEAPGRSFQEVIDIFKPTLHPLDVVVFTYDLTRIQSLQDLASWMTELDDLVVDTTHFILLGTHLDQADLVEVSDQEIEKSLGYLASQMRSMRPTWKGNFAHLEVSNLTGENLKTLIFYLAGSVVSARQMQS